MDKILKKVLEEQDRNSFSLLPNQVEAFEFLYDCLQKKVPCFTLEGAAGTGKTTVSSIFMKYLILAGYSVYCSSTTHKAKNVSQDMLNGNKTYSILNDVPELRREVLTPILNKVGYNSYLTKQEYNDLVASDFKDIQIVSGKVKDYNTDTMYTNLIEGVEVLVANNKSIPLPIPKVSTVHSLYNLRPSYIHDNRGDVVLKFTTKNTKILPAGAVLIIEECSMLAEETLKIVTSIHKEVSDICILFIGDDKQALPINEKKISKTFRSFPKFTLKVIVRQENTNDMKEVISTFRDKQDEKIVLPVISKLKKVDLEEEGKFTFKGYKVTDSKAEFNLLAKKMFKTDAAKKDLNFVKIIAYTNKAVEAYNKMIRTGLGLKGEYEEGDVLMGYNTIGKIENAKFYKVINVKLTNLQPYSALSPETVKSLHFSKQKIDPDAVTLAYLEQLEKASLEISRYKSDLMLKGYNLVLESDDGKLVSINVLSKDNKIDDLITLAEDAYAIKDAIAKAKNKDYKEILTMVYEGFSKQVLSSKDLPISSNKKKIGIPKSIDFGFAISAHKSQSVTNTFAFVDFNNIYMKINSSAWWYKNYLDGLKYVKNHKKEDTLTQEQFFNDNLSEFNKLMYVACSRPTNGLFILK